MTTLNDMRAALAGRLNDDTQNEASPDRSRSIHDHLSDPRSNRCRKQGRRHKRRLYGRLGAWFDTRMERPVECRLRAARAGTSADAAHTTTTGADLGAVAELCVECAVGNRVGRDGNRAGRVARESISVVSEPISNCPSSATKQHRSARCARIGHRTGLCAAACSDLRAAALYSGTVTPCAATVVGSRADERAALDSDLRAAPGANFVLGLWRLHPPHPARRDAQ
jgi:hypothetical protein